MTLSLTWFNLTRVVAHTNTTTDKLLLFAWLQQLPVDVRSSLFMLCSKKFNIVLRRQMKHDHRKESEENGDDLNCANCALLFQKYHLDRHSMNFKQIKRCACACECFGTVNLSGHDPFCDTEVNPEWKRVTNRLRSSPPEPSKPICCQDLNNMTVQEIYDLSLKKRCELFNVKHLKVLLTLSSLFHRLESIVPSSFRAPSPTTLVSSAQVLDNVHVEALVKTFLNSPTPPFQPQTNFMKRFDPLFTLRHIARDIAIDGSWVWVTLNANNNRYDLYDALCQKINPPKNYEHIFEIDDERNCFSAFGVIMAIEIKTRLLHPLRVLSGLKGQEVAFAYTFVLHSVVEHAGLEPPKFVNAFPFTLDRVISLTTTHAFSRFLPTPPKRRRLRVAGFYYAPKKTIMIVRFDKHSFLFYPVFHVTKHFHSFSGRGATKSVVVETSSQTVQQSKEGDRGRMKFGRAKNHYYAIVGGIDTRLDVFDLFFRDTGQLIVALSKPGIHLLDDSVSLF